MFGIRIKDSKLIDEVSILIDLSDILLVIGEPVLNSRWICRDLDYTLMKEGRLYEIRESRRRFSGAEFRHFAHRIRQVIDGRFEARTEGPAKKIWLVLVVFDSSWIDVWSTKQEVLEKLRARFKKINDLSPEVMKASLEQAQRKHRG